MDEMHADGPPLIDLQKVITNLVQRWKLIAIVTVSTIMLAAAYIAITPPLYTAEAIILVDPREIRLTDANEVLSGIGSDSAAITSQLAVLQSRDLLMPVLERENVFSDPEFTRSGENRDAVFERVLRSITVERQGLTYVIEVNFRSKSPETAARMANAIVNAYISAQVNEKSQITVQATSLLEDQIADLRNGVAKAEAAVEDFRSKNGMLDIEVGKTLLQSQIDQLSQQVLGAHERARQAQSRYDQASKLKGLSGALVVNADVLASTTADELRREYNARSVEQSRMSRIYGQRHPQLIAINSQLAQLDALMKAETSRIIQRLENELQLAKNNAGKAEADLDTLRQAADTMGQKDVVLRQLQLQAQTSRDVLQQFLRRAKETKQLDGMQRSEARIISAAVPANTPIWPKGKLLLAVAAVIGSVAGIMLALLLGPVETGTAYSDKPAPGKGGLRRWFERQSAGRANSQLPILGTVKTNAALLPGSGNLTPRHFPRVKTELKNAPTSEFSLGVWSLMERIFDLLPTKRGPHLILFTDLGSRAGKYCMTYNIALALKRLGASVLVLDLDSLDRSNSYADLISELRSHEPLERKELVDFSTGLPVLYLKQASPGISMQTIDATVIDGLLNKASGSIDFILVNSQPWRNGKGIEAFSSRQAQMVFVVSSKEIESLNSQDIAQALGENIISSCIVLEPSSRPGSEKAETQRGNQRSLSRRAG